MPRKFNIANPLGIFPSWVFVVFVSSCLTSAVTRAQFDPMGGDGPAAAPPDTVKHNDDPIKILTPTVDKKAASVTIPAAFWNQKMANWVEVAVCGRPSDFLHETIISTTTTKKIMEQAMRDAGFHDADAWVKTVRDFPRIRGDRFIIILNVTRKDKPNSPVESYSLDELLTFQGWGVTAGPYGWMFKGDPERSVGGANAGEAAPAEAEPNLPDRTKILRDDPQVALVFKGIQHQSQSYADNPLAYDDWIYPMMRYNRNYKILPEAVYDSNGEFPVTMTLQKVNEEQFLTESAKLWHDEDYKKHILAQLPIAKKIDVDKAALWALLPDFKKIKETPPELRDAVQEADTIGKAALLAANIEKGYAQLDAAWARWAADHPVFESMGGGDDRDLAELKKQARRWRDHMEQKQKRAEQLAIAQDMTCQIQQLDRQPQTDATKKERQQLMGKKLEARYAALLAEDTQPKEYWKWEQSRIDKEDPRVAWKKAIDAQVGHYDADSAVGNTGLAYARALQSASPAEIEAADKLYREALVGSTVAELKLQIVNVDFEIEKRESFGPDDPEVKQFQIQKQKLESQLQSLVVAPTTPPAKQNP